jgi:hypothetical protein
MGRDRGVFQNADDGHAIALSGALVEAVDVARPA